MADCFILLNSGDKILLNDGVSALLMNSCDEVVVTPTGGGSGGTVKKSIGYQLTDLGPRPHVIQQGESISKVALRPQNLSRSKIVIQIRGESRGTVIPYFGGVSTAKLLIPIKSESHSALYYKTKGESWGIPHPSAMISKNIHQTEKMRKAVRALTNIILLDSII